MRSPEVLFAGRSPCFAGNRTRHMWMHRLDGGRPYRWATQAGKFLTLPFALFDDERRSRTGVWKCHRSLSQTPAPVLDKISRPWSPMGALFLSSTGLQFGTLIVRAQLSPAPPQDKNRSPIHNIVKQRSLDIPLHAQY